MAWNTNISSGSGSDGSTDTGAGAIETILLATWTANIQEYLDNTEIAWGNIDWAILKGLDSPVFDPISAAEPPEYEQEVDEFGEPNVDADGEPIYLRDSNGDLIPIIDNASDLFLAIGGTFGNDILRNEDYSFPDGNGTPRLLNAAMMGFSGDDAIFSGNMNTAMLMGGSGDDDYILETTSEGINRFAQIVENGNDDDDTVISYNNDWAFAVDINGQHLLLSDATQEDVFIIWNYNVPEAKIENFWFDLDKDGINEHYNFDEFLSALNDNNFFAGSFQPEALGISGILLDDLTNSISKATALSTEIENFRKADIDTATSIARLYQTAFDRTPDVEGLNFWINEWEDVSQNLSIGRLADNFYSSEEFSLTYGALDNNSYITQLYANVLDRTPDQAGLDFWTNALSEGEERADVMVGFSESLENKINTELQLSGLAEVTPGEWVL